MRHMLVGENKALITARSNKSPNIDQFFISKHTVEIKCGESTIGSYTFPLFLYSVAERKNLFAQHESSERRPNISPEIFQALEKAYKTKTSPEDIFNYIYAVFYAQTYRDKYKEFLKIDFPRVPFTADQNLFNKLAALGERLVGLHLLKSPELDPPAARFEGEGDNRVAKNKSKGFRYDPEEKRVYINKTQYFGPVQQEVWEYQIGGYQVCEKWLKDRRERQISIDDIKTYCRIVTAIEKTIEIQKDIDALYPKVEADLLHLELTST